MKPLLHPAPVNGPFEDPVLYVDFLYGPRALLFDLGTVRSLSPRKLLRVTDVFVTHTHMDHFLDFDWLLRLFLGRDKTLRLFGPAGFVDRVEHRLRAYTWNVVRHYATDLTLIATEVLPGERGHRAEFHLRRAFARGNEADVALPGGRIVDETGIAVHAAVLDHGTPCLGFAVREKVHVNIWKTRLEEMGLPTGRWLRELRKAVLAGVADDTPIRAWWKEAGETRERTLPLGELKREAMQIVPGPKFAYVVDVRDTAENREAIVRLAADADLFFIETAFLDEDAEQAARKYHLTARQAGEIAARARAKALVPLHFSPRYEGREAELRKEALDAFRQAI